MNISPMIKADLLKIGEIPSVSTLDLGVQCHRRKERVPKPLTPEECMSLFGKKEAVSMNFIPQMLVALALDQIEEFVDYCVEHKLEVYKKHNRELRKCIDNYNKGLQKSYGRAWFAYRGYYKRLLGAIPSDLFKCWCVYTNEAARQFVGMEHKDIPAKVCFVRMLLTFVEDFERNMDKVISSKIDAPCTRKQDPWLVLISALCIDIAETFGHIMKINDTMALCVKVLANRCRQVVYDIIDEEDATGAPSY